jgi:hypothetical protein
MRIVRSSVSFIGPLDTLEGLIALLRSIPGIREAGPGAFSGSRSRRSWLHIHEDAAGVLADVRTGKEWQRFHMSQPEEREAFMVMIGRRL